MNHEKKILFIDFNIPFLLQDQDYPVGGATVQVLSWIKGLLANNVKVGVITGKNSSGNLPINLDISIFESYNPNSGLPYLKWITHRLPKLIWAIGQFQPDYVYQACAGFLTGPACYAAHRNKSRFIYRVANDVDADERYKTRLPFFEQIGYKAGIRYADVILCQNQYQYIQFRERFPKKNIQIFHNPIVTLNDAQPPLSFANRSYIAWIGIFQYQKNLPALLDIVNALPEIQFKIAGKKKNALDAVTTNALEQLKNRSNVEFKGYLDRTAIIDFLSHAKALLNTSHFEGFSNTYLEAWTVGTPVITTQNANPDNIISQNELGLVADTYTQLPEIINQCFQEKIFNGISAQTQKYVYSHHEASMLAKKFINTFW